MGPSFSPQLQGSMGRVPAEARLQHPRAGRPRCCLWEGPAGWRLSGTSGWCCSSRPFGLIKLKLFMKRELCWAPPEAVSPPLLPSSLLPTPSIPILRRR